MKDMNLTKWIVSPLEARLEFSDYKFTEETQEVKSLMSEHKFKYMSKCFPVCPVYGFPILFVIPPQI